jgi:cyanophycinase
MQVVDRFLLEKLRSEAHVVCLPTAAGTEGVERITYWMELGHSHFAGMGVMVEALPVVDQPSANDPDLVERIRQANFVYLSGGKPDYLYRTLNGSLAWAAIMEVLNRGGILAGCSAGAMIMGERIPGFPRMSPAFGLLKGALIVPHFDEIPQSMVNSLRFLVRDGQLLLGIEGNTALVGDGQEYEVLGSAGVWVWNHHGKKRYAHGESVSWH